MNPIRFFANWNNFSPTKMGKWNGVKLQGIALTRLKRLSVSKAAQNYNVTMFLKNDMVIRRACDNVDKVDNIDNVNNVDNIDKVNNDDIVDKVLHMNDTYILT